MSPPIEIFDTDLLSEYLRNRLEAVTYFRATPPDSYHTTVINEIELLQPIFRTPFGGFRDFPES